MFRSTITGKCYLHCMFMIANVCMYNLMLSTCVIAVFCKSRSMRVSIRY